MVCDGWAVWPQASQQNSSRLSFFFHKLSCSLLLFPFPFFCSWNLIFPMFPWTFPSIFLAWNLVSLICCWERQFLASFLIILTKMRVPSQTLMVASAFLDSSSSSLCTRYSYFLPFICCTIYSLLFLNKGIVVRQYALLFQNVNFLQFLSACMFLKWSNLVVTP